MTQGASNFTWSAARAGMRGALPMLLAIVPFGIVTGIVSQGNGLSLLEAGLMSAFVFSGSAQLLALSHWGHPAPILAAGLAALIVNLRLALMGPVLAPWLNRIDGWRLWTTLALMVDQAWAISLRELQAKRHDAAYLFGAGALIWLIWLVSTITGFFAGSALRPAPGHPLFFTALAVFVAMLAGMWRGRTDLMPWLVAAAVSAGTAWLLPGTSWYIVIGALAGSGAATWRDVRRQA